MIYSITVPFVKVFCASQHMPHFYKLFTCTADPHAYCICLIYMFNIYIYIYIYIYICIY